MVSEDFRKQMACYGLTTANILYRRPDHPWLLQAYIWQAYDVCPNFPELQRFLEFWQTSLRSEEHTSELQSHLNLVCRLLLEKKKNHNIYPNILNSDVQDIHENTYQVLIVTHIISI